MIKLDIQLVRRVTQGAGPSYTAGTGLLTLGFTTLETARRT